MRMRVGIDARLISWPGIGRHIQLLLAGLADLHDAVAVTAYVTEPDVTAVPGYIQAKIVSARPFSIAERRFWASELSDAELDVFHSPHFGVPGYSKLPRVVTIHDLAPLRFPSPGALGPARDLYTRWAIQRAVRIADSLITVSQFSRSEIEREFGRRDATVIANAYAVSELTTGEGQPEASNELPSRYVLYVGTNKPWKNLEVALRGADRASVMCPGMAVVLAGKQAKNQEPLSRLIERVRPTVPIVTLGSVPDAALARLYRGASAVVCPSLYEGFGLTALEALAAGSVVIHSGCASLPEVVGEAGLVADPRDPESWAERIRQVWNDPLAAQELRQLGVERAAGFSVARMATETLEVYRRARARFTAGNLKASA